MKKQCFIIWMLVVLLVLAGCQRCEHVFADATCITLSTCTLCGETIGELADHSFSEATCTTPATCVVCSLTQGEPLPHTFSEATCTTPATCKVCKATEGETAAHQYAEPTCAVPATCTVCGATDGSVVDHKYSEATCTTPATCTFCGLTDGEVLPHVLTEATCAAPATCTACGATDGKLLAHTFSEVTCLEYATCKNCGATGTEKGAHKYSKGACTLCGQRDKGYDEIAGILRDIERYPDFLGHLCGIVDAQIQLYNINGSASVLADIVKNVSDMNDYVNKIRAACSDNRTLYPIFSQCNIVKYPGVAGSSTSAIRNYISNVRSFSRQCSHVCDVYNIYAKDYGLR